jgi:hypothetical protein
MRSPTLSLSALVRSVLREASIRMSHDPHDWGAYIDDDAGISVLPVVEIPLASLSGFEDDEKMEEPVSRRRMLRMVAALRSRGPAVLPPILVRRHPEDPTVWQVIDGHHRFHAHILAGLDRIHARVVPDEMIRDV